LTTTGQSDQRPRIGNDNRSTHYFASKAASSCSNSVGE
jgi:hypothetical protein